jgi:hypothetical protein
MVQVETDNIIERRFLKTNNKIKKELSEYIEFDLDLIINKTNDYAYVFGGAVRDVLAGREIHDIDILCLPTCAKNVAKTLEEQGYKYNDLMGMKDMFRMYSDIHCISEPRTYMKNNKIVQIIVPTFNDLYHMKNRFNAILSQVDISCCGVYFSNIGLGESVNNAILHCRHSIFYDMKLAEMHHPTRCELRKQKLISRGWTDVENTRNQNKIKDILKQIDREKKLQTILL